MVKVAVSGAGGRMGTSILKVLFKDPEIDIVGTTEAAGHHLLGCDLGVIVNSTGTNITVTQDMGSAFKDAEVVIDFTTPASTLLTAAHCSTSNKSMVVGTTGFSREERKKLEQMAEKIPIVISPNMSIGVNLAFEISKLLATRLGDEFDVEIVETHHKDKVDAPSGTAIALAKSVAQGLGVDPDTHVRFERQGDIGKRKKGEIGVQTLRGGDVVGDHTVMFLGRGERLEITHRALSRENFSRGVLRAAKWIAGKKPGVYSMKDILGI